MRLFSSIVNVKQIALETEGWSGVDLAGLVGNALSHAIERASGGNLESIDEDNILVVQEDFDAAKEKTCPRMERHIIDFLERCRCNGFVSCGGENDKVLKTIEFFAKKVKANKFNHLESCLLEGPSGTGKTTLAATAALSCTFTYVNVISSQLMIGFSESTMCTHILKVLEDAHESTSSFIILDDIERLIDHKSTGDVAMALLSILTCTPPKGKNVLVIGTTNNQKSLESSGILDAFSEKLNVGELEAESIKTILENVLDSSGLFQDEDYSSAAEEISRVPIKKLYRALSFAGNDEEEFDSESLNRCMKFLKGKRLHFQ